MKLITDETTIYRETPPETARLTHTPAELFQKFYAGNWDELAAKIPGAKTSGDVAAQWEALAQNVDRSRLKEANRLPFLYKEGEPLGWQKTTYEVEENEDFEKIARALENQETGSIARALELDPERRRITVWTAAPGAWQVADKIFVKNVEAKNKLEGKIRNGFTLRKIEKPEEIQTPTSLDRIDFPIFEDLQTLFDKKLIENFKKSKITEKGEELDPAGRWIYDYHFAKDLSEEDLKKIGARDQAREEIKKETTHVGKGQANKAQVKETIERNEKEIHTTHAATPAKKASDLEKIVEEKEKAVKSFEQLQLEKLEERQRAEREKLEEMIKQAEKDRKAASKLLLNALENGNTIEEAKEHLQAAKFNEITIAAAFEELKTDLLISSKKDEIIAAQEKELAKIEILEKKLEQSEQARKTNYERYQQEIEYRQRIERERDQIRSERDEIERKALRVAELSKAKIEAQSAEIADLKTEIVEKDKMIENLENELEKLDIETSAEIDDLKEKIEEIKQDSSTKIEALESHVEAVEKRAQIAAARAEERGKALESEQKRNEKLENKLDETQKEIRKFAEILEKIKAENEQLKKQIEEAAAMKKELSKLTSAVAVATAENERLREELEKLAEGHHEEEIDENFDGAAELQRLALEVLGEEEPGKSDDEQREEEEA